MSAIIIKGGRIIDPANDRDEIADLVAFVSRIDDPSIADESHR